jgi:hypothetical protein
MTFEPPRWALPVVLLFACSDDSAAAQDESDGESAADTHASTDGDTGSTSPGESSSTTALDDTSADDTGDSTTEDTGEPEPEVIEILIFGQDGDSPSAFFDYRYDQGDIDAVPLVDPGAAVWGGGTALLSERRVVFGAGSQLFLGSLDGDPSDVVPIDGPPIESGDLSRPFRVPGSDAVVVRNADSGSVYRIDVDGGVPTAPVAVAHDTDPQNDFQLERLVDPLGRWLMFDRDLGAVNVALAPLDTPDPDAAIAITDLAPPFSARHLGFMPDGGGVAYATFEATGAQDDPARELWFVPVDDDGIGAPQLVHSQAAPADEVQHWVPHPASLGFVYSVGRYASDHVLGWSAIVDGVSQPPVELATSGVFDPPLWSPDGEWLAYATIFETSGERFLVRLTDGEPGEPTSIDTFDIDPLAPSFRGALFSADSSTLFIAREGNGIREIVRFVRTDDGWDDGVVVVADDESLQLGELEATTADGGTLLFVARDGDTKVFILDVSGPEPGEPVIVSGPATDPAWAWAPRFSPQEQFVVYESPTDLFAEDRLMLVDLASPGEAIEIIGDQLTWQFVPPP